MNRPDRILASIFVPGVPRAQGSKRAFVVKGKDGKSHAAMSEDSKWTRPWRADIRKSAGELEVYREEGPVGLQLAFTLPRPKSADKGAGKLKTPYELAVKKPDLDKLTRAVLDALTAVWYKDDVQVVSALISKQVALPGQRAGVRIEMTEVQ